MEKEGQDNSPASPRSIAVARTGHSLAFKIAAVALVTLSTSATGFLMYGWWRSPPDADIAVASAQAQTNAAPAPTAPRLFRSWPTDRKPDVVLLLTGQVNGYMQPCGCSEPQYGGLERRFNLVQTLTKERGWPIIPLDLGDVAQHTSPDALLKYKYTMDAMKRLGYAAVGIGVNETTLPLFEALGEYALNNPTPRVVSANLLNVPNKFPDMVWQYEVAERPGSPLVGAVGVVAPSVAQEIKDPDAKFGPVDKALKDALDELAKKKAELLVLLFQGSLSEAKQYAKKFPQFQVILCASVEEEPPARPTEIGNTFIIEVGHKGRHVGMLAAYRTGDPAGPFKLHYELVTLGPEYKTPEGKDDSNPILALLENYAREVKSKKLLMQYPRTTHPIQQQFPNATYVGSLKCKSCHRPSFKVWEASPHSHAYATLETAKRPGLRQYDGECVSCHVTGFAFESGFTDEQKTPLLKNNGCENCHGPGSLHVADQYDKTLYALMNPYKTQPNETPEQKTLRENRLNDSCTKCHDTDNDVHWDLKKWITGKIVHSEK
jgi:hypothetical protein